LKPVKSEIIYGIHPVFEALNAARRRFFELFIEKKKASQRITKIIGLVESKKLPLKKIESDQMNALIGTGAHQGVAARVSPYPFAALDDILVPDDIAAGTCGLLLLDQLQDPHNLGAIIRTASCAGINGIVLPKDRSVPPTPAVSKASAGALEHMKVARVTNMARTVTLLKERGLWIIGADLAAQQSIYASDLTGPAAFVIGSEHRGIRPLVKEKCDMLVSIPLTGPIQSLNASVAAGIVVYEAYRQRRKSMP
jgi:23S rRNA (guanosine2251-2'-O)-methyltransferase